MLQILFIHGSWFAKEACLMILMFLYLFHVQPLWESNPNGAKSLEFKGIGEEKKKAFKNIKGRPLVLSNESPPLFPSFSFPFSLSTSPSFLCASLMAIVQVITSTPAHYHFTITCVVSSHREEKGEWGGNWFLKLMGLWSRYHASNCNSYNSYCSNIREKEKGGGAPFSNLLGVFFRYGVFGWQWLQ